MGFIELERPMTEASEETALIAIAPLVYAGRIQATYWQNGETLEGASLAAIKNGPEPVE